MSRVPFKVALVPLFALTVAGCFGGGGGDSSVKAGGGDTPSASPVERFGTCFRDAFNAVRNGEPIDPPLGCLAPPEKTADPIEIN